MNNIDRRHFFWIIRGFYSTTFAKILLCVIIGILVGRWSLHFAEYNNLADNGIGISFLWSVPIALSAFFMILFVIAKWKRALLFRIAEDVMWVSLGAFLITAYPLPKRINDTAYNTYVVKITSNPLYNNGYYRADAKLLTIGDNEDSTHCSKSIVGTKILLNFKPDSINGVVPQLCDRFLISDRLSLPSPNGNPYTFDYGEYLRVNGYSAVAYLYPPYYSKLAEGKPETFLEYLYQLRHYLLSSFRRIGLEGEELAIISAITLGEKGMLSANQKADFAAAGVQHILVVSGMHVGFIYLLLIVIIHRCQRKKLRYIGAIFGIIVMWGYAVLTGFAPAVVRATLMFTIMLIFDVFRILYRTYHALFLAAIISLLVKPYLLFDVGFLLSYLAVGSIAFFYPKIYVWLRKIGIRNWLIDRTLQAVALTVSAQIFTFPIVIYAFNQFPIYFIFTNIVATFITPIIFFGGIIVLLFNHIPLLGLGLGLLLKWLVKGFIWVVTCISSLPQAVCEMFVSKSEVMLIYIVLLMVVNIVMMRQYKDLRFSSLVILLATLFVVTIVDTFIVADRIGDNQLLILKNKRLCVDVISDDSSVIFANAADTAYFVKELQPLHRSKVINQPYFVTDTALISNNFVCNGETFIVLRDNVFRFRYNKGNPLLVDCLIIDRGVYPTAKLFDEFILPQRVYLTAGVWSGYIERYKQLLSERGIAFECL